MGGQMTLALVKHCNSRSEDVRYAALKALFLLKRQEKGLEVKETAQAPNLATPQKFDDASDKGIILLLSKEDKPKVFKVALSLAALIVPSSDEGLLATLR